MSDVFFAATYPKARKAHVCAMCHRAIERGETYRRQGYVYDGRRDATKLCTQCYTFAGILSKLGFEDDEGHWPWIGEVDQSEVAHCGYSAEMGHFRMGWRLSDGSLFAFPAPTDSESSS